MTLKTLHEVFDFPSPISGEPFNPEVYGPDVATAMATIIDYLRENGIRIIYTQAGRGLGSPIIVPCFRGPVNLIVNPNDPSIVRVRSGPHRCEDMNLHDPDTLDTIVKIVKDCLRREA